MCCVNRLAPAPAARRTAAALRALRARVHTALGTPRGPGRETRPGPRPPGARPSLCLVPLASLPSTLAARARDGARPGARAGPREETEREREQRKCKSDANFRNTACTRYAPLPSLIYTQFPRARALSITGTAPTATLSIHHSGINQLLSSHTLSRLPTLFPDRRQRRVRIVQLIVAALLLAAPAALLLATVAALLLAAIAAVLSDHEGASRHSRLHVQHGHRQPSHHTRDGLRHARREE